MKAMAKIEYTPTGVCARKIDIETEGGVVKEVSFTGGCDGNLKAISKLISGMPVQDVIGILEGNTCGRRPTSCADQLAQALKQDAQA